MLQKKMVRQHATVVKKIGRPPGRSRPDSHPVRVPVDVLRQLDDWISAQPEPRPSRPEAVRRILHAGLMAEFGGRPVAVDELSEASGLSGAARRVTKASG